MRILLVSHQFPSDDLRYSGRFVEDQLNAIIRCGCNAQVLQVLPTPLRLNGLRMFLSALWNCALGHSAPLYSGAAQVGIRLYSPGIRMGGGVQSILNTLAVLWFLTLKKTEFRIDCIHAHTGLSDGLIALALGRRYGVPYVLTEHTAPYEALLRGPGSRRIVQSVLKNAAAVVAVSKYLRSCILDCFPGVNIQVVGNTFDESVFCFQQSQSFNHQAPLLLWIGHFSERKRLDLALRALGALRDSGIKAKLRVITGVESSTKIKNLIVSLGLEGAVTLEEAADREKVARHLRDASVVLVTSEVETFSVVTLEALATGVPVVSTDCGGPRDLILDREDGFIDTNGEPQTLADFLAKAIKSDSEELRRQRAKNATERFGMLHIGRVYERIYASAIQGER